jgi:carbon-monoxide dehydrogenase medium subunit
LKPFDYVAADSVEKAVEILTDNSPSARPVAGATDVLNDIRRGLIAPKLLVDISGVAELQGIEIIDRGLRIGSLVTHSEIIKSPLIKEHAPALADASLTVGAVQTRNMGTLAGNLVSAVPSLDGAPVLMALDASVTIAGSGSREELALKDFFLGPRQTVLGPDRILVDMLIPKANLGKAASFAKFGLRKGQALALINVAASLNVDAATGRAAQTRIALGAVAPKPIHASEAGRIAATEASPIDDFRASAAYRIELIKVLTRRVLSEAYSQAMREPGGR